MSDSYVSVEGLDSMKVLVLAPGASRETVSVHVEKSGEEQKSAGMIYVKVKKPEVPEVLNDVFEKVDLEVESKIVVPERYDVSSVKVGVQDGIVAITLGASSDALSKVEVGEGFGE